MVRRHPNPLLDPRQYARRSFGWAHQQHILQHNVCSVAMIMVRIHGSETILRVENIFPATVIVGAGAAGCVLASKISEDQNVSVLLLEAGGDNTKVLESKVPLMFPKLFHTEHDWDYYTVEQPGLAARQLYWRRGRLIGGSTSLNAMIYHHCSPSDFDEWASVHRCEG